MFRDFESKFRNRFLNASDHEDLLIDLKQRAQGKGEKITAYISALRYIAYHFSRTPRASRVVGTAWRGLFRSTAMSCLYECREVYIRVARRDKSLSVNCNCARRIEVAVHQGITSGTCSGSQGGPSRVQPASPTIWTSSNALCENLPSH